MDEFIVTFESISHALMFEKVTKKEAEVKHIKLKPIPRNLSSSCGTCALIGIESKEKLENIIETKRLHYDDIVRYTT